MADEATPQTAPLEGVTQDGGTTRVQLQGDPQADAQANVDLATIAPAEKTTTERPEGLPEGFDTWEAYGKAQLAKGTEEAPEAKEPAIDPAIEQALQDLPEDRREVAQPFFQEFAEKGELSPESIKAAAIAFNVSEAMVRAYVKGAQAESAQAYDAVMQPLYAAAGDRDTFDAFSTWAREGGMTAEQIAALEDKMNTKDGTAAVATAVDAWKAAGHAPAPRDVAEETPGGEGLTQPAVVGYASQAEMQRDMNDPRYNSDPAFRQVVEQKVLYAKF